VCDWIAKIERAEMPPAMAADFTLMCVAVKNVITEHAHANRERNGAERAADRRRLGL